MVNCVSSCDKRFLETSITVKDDDEPAVTTEDVPYERAPAQVFRIRFHPQGNKDSNKDFCFFQVFPITHVNNYKVKFHVYNNKGEELSLTVYQGNQQLNGYFEYVRRDYLLQHIAPEDEVYLNIKLTVFTEPVTRTGFYSNVKDEVIVDDVGKDLEDLFNNPKFTDFKIKCKNGNTTKSLDVHRSIISSRSAFFKAMLSDHTRESKEGQVVFDDIDYTVLYELLRFLYTGRAPNADKMASDLLALADRFQVNVLKKIAEKSMKKMMSVKNVCATLTMADLYSANELKDEALNFIADNSTEVVKTEGWQSMLKNHSRLLTDVIVKMNDSSRMEPLPKRLRKS
ncbi:unnamed protein product [Bursaphelenchus xylophilus]|uniref:(pine wood nematode) hypothetical protein n=1 Tax=Bursaphelenchus xylophilus TaxID=6326 RepID=A0A1I7SWQ7_BURXY|nr:unnamed protein product [Bursaphelenchus xylophilus]CAG9099809.1 unnamed protein product [Bursaphelenchus xylophilus]